MPVCGSYGARDTSTPAEDVRAFRDALRVPNDIRVYNSAGHAFFDDQRASYSPAAAVDAWKRTLDCFKLYLEATDADGRAVDPRRSRSRGRNRRQHRVARRTRRISRAAHMPTLAESQRTGEKSIEALLERAKNELGETTAARASERVNELVAPVSQKLGEFEKLMREIESGRKHDAGGLKEQLSGLLRRTEQLETAAVQLSSQTSSLVSALRNPTTRGKWGEVQLRRVVELAGMEPYCDFTEQQTFDSDEGQGRHRYDGRTARQLGDLRRRKGSAGRTPPFLRPSTRPTKRRKRDRLRAHANAMKQHPTTRWCARTISARPVRRTSS